MYMQTCIGTYVHTWIYMYMCIHMCMCMYVYMCLHVYVIDQHIYTCIQTYTHAPMHTCICTHRCTSTYAESSDFSLFSFSLCLSPAPPSIPPSFPSLSHSTFLSAPLTVTPCLSLFRAIGHVGVAPWVGREIFPGGARSSCAPWHFKMQRGVTWGEFFVNGKNGIATFHIFFGSIGVKSSFLLLSFGARFFVVCSYFFVETGWRNLSICLSLYKYTYESIYMCACVCLCVCVYIHMYMYIYIYVYIYIYIHEHVYTQHINAYICAHIYM